MSTHKIAVLSGDGIGPEVMIEAKKILQVIEKFYPLSWEIEHAPVGGVAIEECGEALPQKTIDLCQQSDAILFGAVGGPQWESLPAEKQPERASLLPLRKQFDLFANLRPAIVFDSLKDISPLRADIIQSTLNILIVRELTGGIYFGSPKGIEEHRAFDTLVYTRKEIERITHVAFQIAQKRNKKVCSIDKANVLSSMVFWRKIVSETAKQYPDVTLSHLYVDNAAMQLIVAPSQFDVILCGNMFGDILSDEASVLSGSLGMLPSASLSESSSTHSRFGLYEPSGGSAPDIAGKNIANPIAQILSVALMMKYSFHEDKIHDAIFTAVSTVLHKGLRTRDIMRQGFTELNTTEMGNHISTELHKLHE